MGPEDTLKERDDYDRLVGRRQSNADEIEPIEDSGCMSAKLVKNQMLKVIADGQKLRNFQRARGRS